MSKWPFLSAAPNVGGVRLQIQAQPNARKTQIIGLHGDALKVKIKAPPEDGRANAELEGFLAQVFGVAKTGVSVVAGASARRKQIVVAGVTVSAAEEALAIQGLG